MSKKLKLIQIPMDALNSHAAIMGKTGSGKTFTAKGAIEMLLAMNRPFGAIDPTDAWWGMRLQSDGVTPAYPVIILGGDYGDHPLYPHAGAACADLLATGTVQIVFSTIHMGVGERTRWFTDFATRLQTVNRTPLNLVIDEAHFFAPQGKVADPMAGKMLNAANTLASAGRSRGIRLLLITQRPAKLHKDTLTSCEGIVAMRMVAPQDREAVAEWIKGSGDPAKAREVLDSLAQLDCGEGWMWFPELGVLDRGHFPKIKTFDSSRTPDAGTKRPEPPKSLSEIDLSKITAALDASADAVKHDDPKSLRKRVKELEEKLTNTEQRYRQELSKPVTIHADVRVAELERDNIGLSEENRKLRSVIQSIAEIVSNETHHSSGAASSSRGVMPGADSAGRQTAPSGSDPHPIDERRAPAARAIHVRPAPPEQSGSGGGLTGPQRKILNAVAWWNAFGIESPTRVQVAAASGYSSKSSSFENTLSNLRVNGRIMAAQGTITLTATGRGMAAKYSQKPPIREVQDQVRGILDRPVANLLDALLQAPSEISRDNLAKAAGVSPTSSAFENNVSKLSSLGFLIRVRPGVVKAAPWLKEVK